LPSVPSRSANGRLPSSQRRCELSEHLSAGIESAPPHGQCEQRQSNGRRSSSLVHGSGDY
jgi:hypothetical protein